MAALAAVTTGPASPAAAEPTPPPTPYIVSTGDSFISGEGAMWAVRGWAKDIYQQGPGTMKFIAGNEVVIGTGTTLLTAGSGAMIGDTLYAADTEQPLGVIKKVDKATQVTLTAPATEDYEGPVKVGKPDQVAAGLPYATTDSYWQTAPGKIEGTLPFKMDNWNSIYGDKNDYPATGGIQDYPFCARSYSSPGNIGSGWQHKNLACSGAIKDSVVSKGQNGLTGTQFYNIKAGVDFYDQTLPTNLCKSGSFGLNPCFGEVVSGSGLTRLTGKGQAKQLQDFAEENEVKVVVLSVGGNDFGFADLIMDCVKGFAGGGLFTGCENKGATYLSEANLDKVRTAVFESARNVRNAMRAAGKEDGSWRLVFQDPPLPVGTGAHTKYSGMNRQNYGGCGFTDGTLDWINAEVYPKLTAAMEDGLVKAKEEELGDTPIIHLVTKDAFKRHLLCGKDTVTSLNYALGQAGKEPVWQDDNGKKTEWVNGISYSNQAIDNYSIKSLPIHPNYWGQRALSACVQKAAETEHLDANLRCEQDSSNALDREGRPKMRISRVTPLGGGDPVAVGRPTVSGGTTVGSTLTATVGESVFAPAGIYDLEFQWLKDGEPISGATTSTYVVRNDDEGSLISVSVRVGEAEASSEEIGPISKELSVDGAYTLDGTEQVGETLTINDSAVVTEPATGITYNYIWLRDGQRIPRAANSDSYTLTWEDAQHTITAKLILEFPGAPDLTVETEASGEIAKGRAASSGKPTISGSEVAGETLTADSSGVTFTPELERVSFQWYRDGEAIPGATGSTHTLGGDDYNATITVSVVGEGQGYIDEESEQSDPTGTIAIGTINAVGTPVFDTTPQVGRAVRVNLEGTFSQWTNRPSITWLVDGEEVDGATGIEYTPSGDDLGKMLSAVVTPNDIGFVAEPATVEEVQIVRAETVAVTDQTTGEVSTGKISGTFKVGKTVTATPPKVDPAGGKVSYTWLRNDQPIAGASSASYKARTADAGKKLSVRINVDETTYSTAAEFAVSGQSVTKAPSTTTAKATADKRTATVQVSVRADGVPASDVTGQVAIKVDNKVAQTVSLTGGAATAKVTIKEGKNVIVANYQGNAGLTASTSQQVTVNGAPAKKDKKKKKKKSKKDKQDKKKSKKKKKKRA